MNLAARNFDGDRFGAGKNCRYYCRKMGGDNFGRGKLGKENVPSCSPVGLQVAAQEAMWS